MQAKPDETLSGQLSPLMEDSQKPKRKKVSGKNTRSGTRRGHQPTMRQRRLAAIVADGGLERMSRTEICRAAGYSPSGSEKMSGQYLDANGFYSALAEKGFTINNAKGVISEIMLGKKEKSADRLRACENVLDVYGLKKPENQVFLPIKIEIIRPLSEKKEIEAIGQTVPAPALNEAKNNETTGQTTPETTHEV